jgi:hypothetical protein
MYYMGVHIIYTRGNSLSVSAFVWSHCIWIIVICLPLIIVIIVLCVPRICERARARVCLSVGLYVTERCEKRYYDLLKRIFHLPQWVAYDMASRTFSIRLEPSRRRWRPVIQLKTSLVFCQQLGVKQPRLWSIKEAEIN